MYPTQPQQEKDCEVGEFTAISVSDNLQVVLQEGACAVKLVSDEALLPYIQVSVRDSILYIEYDEKAVPRDVKKVYRGKNAPVPVMRRSGRGWGVRPTFSRLSPAMAPSCVFRIRTR